MRLEGKPIVQKYKEKIKEEIGMLNRAPRLVTLSVDPNESTLSYILAQEKQAKALGIEFQHLTYEKTIAEPQLLQEIERINQNPHIDGVFISHPLPAQFDEMRILSALSPKKDVEGRCPENLGRIAYEKPFFYPCTAEAVMMFFEHYEISLSGKRITIIGRSTTVGKPLCWMLLERSKNATPTVCHTKTQNLRTVLQDTAILVVASGFHGVVTLDDIAENTTVIDVGINFVEGKMVGDIPLDEEKEKKKKISITPTPGGVGPVTNILLMRHVVQQAIRTKET